MSEYPGSRSTEYQLAALHDECHTLEVRLHMLEIRIRTQEQLLESLAIQIGEANAKLAIMQDDGK